MADVPVEDDAVVVVAALAAVDVLVGAAELAELVVFVLYSCCILLTAFKPKESMTNNNNAAVYKVESSAGYLSGKNDEKNQNAMICFRWHALGNHLRKIQQIKSEKRARNTNRCQIDLKFSRDDDH